MRFPRLVIVEFRTTTGSLVSIITAGTFGSVLLQLPLYVPPEVIRMAFGFVAGETKTDAEALFPSHVASIDEDPMPVPTNSPFPFDDTIVSTACHMQFDGLNAISSVDSAKCTLSPCTRLTTAGESCNAPGMVFPEGPGPTCEPPQPIEDTTLEQASRTDNSTIFP